MRFKYLSCITNSTPHLGTQIPNAFVILICKSYLAIISVIKENNIAYHFKENGGISSVVNTRPHAELRKSVRDGHVDT